MVPDHPVVPGGPLSGLAGQAAAVGSDEQIGPGQQVEGVVEAFARPAVVEQRQAGEQGAPAHRHPARPGRVLHRLHQPGRRHPGLADVAPAQGQRRPDRQLAVVTDHQVPSLGSAPCHSGRPGTTTPVTGSGGPGRRATTPTGASTAPASWTWCRRRGG